MPHRRPEDDALLPTLTEEEARELAELTPGQLALIDAMTDEDVARQLGDDLGLAPDLYDPAVAEYFPQAPDPNVRHICERLGVSTSAFADTFGFTAAAVRAWEEGRSRPSGVSLTLLRLLEADPEGVLRIHEKVIAHAAAQLD